MFSGNRFAVIIAEKNYIYRKASAECIIIMKSNNKSYIQSY